MWIIALIGLVLLAAALVVGIDFAMNNSTQVDLEAFNHVWTSNPAAAFVAGVVATLVGVVGLLLLFDGTRRARVQSRARRVEYAERDRLAAERRHEIEHGRAIDLRDRGDEEAEQPQHAMHISDN